jgi:ribokinase
MLKHMKKIAVVGSINIDYFVEANVLPEKGETVLGNQFFMSLGGKGANQAVAASRLGAKVSFFGSIGSDENSNYVIKMLQKEKVDITHLNVAKNSHTGVAFIEICQSENRIVVIPGANRETNISYIARLLDKILEHDIIVLQLETPLEMIEHLVPKLFEKGKTILLNPAPALLIRKEILDKVTYLIPNEHEYQIVMNEKGTMEQLLKKFSNKLLITCGINGVKFFDGKTLVQVPAHKVDAVDTTGAGDTFCGAFAVALSEGKDLVDCIEFGNLAAGLSVKKKGAQSGMPFREEINLFVRGEL